MKWTAAVTILASTLMAGLNCASAQTATKATIPFNFYVGSNRMPSGTYKLEAIRPDLLRLRKVDGGSDAYFLATTHSGALAPSKLVFSKYGNQYFLKETLKTNGQESMTFAPGRLEKEIRSERASLPSESRILAASN